MKKIYNFIFAAIAAIGLFSSCNDDNTGSMNVEGNCHVQELTLNDQFTAQVILDKALLKVKVPVDFTAKRDMTVTKLKLSDGATATVKQGDHLNLTADQGIVVSNNDIRMNWTLSVRNDEALAKVFTLQGIKGSINNETHEITVYVLKSAGVKLNSATFQMTCSEDAECIPASGTRMDFSNPENPVTITVKDNTAVTVYTIRVVEITDPLAIFAGDGATIDELDEEEKAAAEALMGNIAGSAYVSWDDIANGTVSLEKCNLLFYHRNNSYGNYNGFKNAESKAINALPKVKEFWQKGMGIVLQRGAVNYAVALGAITEDKTPNNCWGNGQGNEKMGEKPWSFTMFDTTHALWQNLNMFPGEDDKIFTVDKDYIICNTTSQYGFWDAYENGFADVENVTGVHALGGSYTWYNEKGERQAGNVSSWEIKAYNEDPEKRTFGKGGIICLGSGLFDWHSPSEYTSNYHDNMHQILINAYNYLSK